MAKKKDDSSLESILEQYSAEKTFDFISTGSIVIDAILGGGINLGSMYCCWGSQGSGKSSFALNILKSMLKKGYKCVFLDIEKALNIKQQQSFGVREYAESGQLSILTADNYTDVLKICKVLANSGQYSFIVIDSETMINEVVADDIDVTSNMPGQKARQSAKVLQGLKSIFYKNNVASLIVSHARANLDMTGNPYADKEKIAGGYALRHVPDVILRVASGQKIKQGDNIVGQIVHVMAEKNKFCPPFQKFDVKLYFGKGILKKVELVDVAIAQGLINQSGSFFTLPNGDTVRGTDNLYKNLTSEQLTTLKEGLHPLIEC